MQKFLGALIIFLAVVALGVLCLSVYGQYLLLVADSGVSNSQRFSLLSGIVVSAGVLIAALTFVRERRKMDLERQKHLSEVLLGRASDGFRAVIDLLSDGNNDRVVWVRAARTLLRAKQLGSQIVSDVHKLAYELEEERARADLYIVLTLPDEATTSRKPLPPQFFYGIDDWDTTKTLDEAAVKASQEITAYAITIDSIPPQPSIRPLSPRSVVAIFDFLEYPENYDDPLDDVSDWDEDWGESRAVDQGARRYVAHTKQKYAVSGKLYDKPKVKDASNGS